MQLLDIWHVHASTEARSHASEMHACTLDTPSISFTAMFQHESVDASGWEVDAPVPKARQHRQSLRMEQLVIHFHTYTTYRLDMNANRRHLCELDQNRICAFVGHIFAIFINPCDRDRPSQLKTMQLNMNFSRLPAFLLRCNCCVWDFNMSDVVCYVWCAFSAGRPDDDGARRDHSSYLGGYETLDRFYNIRRLHKTAHACERAHIKC